ncbi:hypothetical protein OOK06_30800 [Streptomyces sp. NBC_00340]|uniref:hypothetical protein n=1 Tax=Streptomyces sp. NBC_00340 TaxID=2975716 RepID=UPI00225280D9|nr:hypothetical protein [Streptomyces sp. NBC_00340]MCX5136462.1 hypothetical protein [Streptomyces sp. NBC_00340]
MRPLKRALVGWPRALRELKELLYEVYLAAGAPSLDAITEDIAADKNDGLLGAPSRDTVHRVITDGERPGQQADVIAVATVLARRAAWDAPDLTGRVRELWIQALMAQGAGRPIGDLRGDVRLILDGGLGVHRALDTGGACDRFGTLPTYVPREHDACLKTVIDAAKEDGRSGIAVLVGGSSTGKTRALWEAVGELPDGWRLLHPLSPTAPEAALAALPDIAPKTVVWLNEAQIYLEPDPLGEQVAAGLRELLHDSSRAPVLVLGTLWPGHWDTLTARTTDDRHAGARELLGGHKIDVPDSFTTAELAALDTTANADPRLTQAGQHAKGAQVTQYLAGVPYLMARYDAARGATLALIHAAMDARRLGAGLHIPLDWLADAAPGYLDDDYHTLDGDWLSKALAYVTTPCNGVPGILTPVTTSGPRNQRTRRRPAVSGTPADQPAPSPQGPRYLLADYLDQHGRHHRASRIPPIDFWTAAAHHAHPTDLTTLGNAAWDRGLYRDAAQLHKLSATHGNPHAAATLVRHLHTLHRTDHRPAQWAAAHAALDNPHAVARLLRALQEVRADEPVTALLARDPAAHAALDNVRAVGTLLRALREVGADEQVTTLAERATGHIALYDPSAVGWLLNELRAVGADEQVTGLAERAVVHTTLNRPSAVSWLREVGADERVTFLAERAAAYTALDDPVAVAELLRALCEVGLDEQVTALAERAVVHTTLNRPSAVSWLLNTLRDVGADEQVTMLAERAAAQAALDDPDAINWLLRALREVGADKQVTTLLARDPAAHTALDNPSAVGTLLRALREVGADEQVTTLAERVAARFALDDPQAIGWLLDTLREVGADEQVTTLLARDPAAHTALNTSVSVSWLLGALRRAGADEQVTTLAERLPAAGQFGLFITLEGNREQFLLGREPNGSAAPSWTWNDMD